MKIQTSYGLAKIGGHICELRINEVDLVEFCKALDDCLRDTSENAQWEMSSTRDFVINEKFQCLRWLVGIDPVGLESLKSTLSLLVGRQPGSYASLALRMAATFLNDEQPRELNRQWNAEQGALALVEEAIKTLRQAKKTGRAMGAAEITNWRYQHLAPSQLVVVSLARGGSNHDDLAEPGDSQLLGLCGSAYDEADWLDNLPF